MKKLNYKNASMPREKALIIIICLAGIAGVVYGMAMDNDAIFVVGIVLVIIGYLRIRKKLKETIQKNNT
ncbi:MAG: DUF2964 family protein [Deltaproteobacteria bacterium]|nr:DUF2964 family protein [Deltaproteobacteria bacterium]